MITEKGTLIVGVEFDGKAHKEFELKPQLVRDSVEAMEDPKAVKNDGYFGVCLLAKQVVRLGGIPSEKITTELLMNLTEIDFKVMTEVKGALENRLYSFRSETKDPAKVDTGSHKDGV